VDRPSHLRRWEARHQRSVAPWPCQEFRRNRLRYLPILAVGLTPSE
jgi:hypothetical protein